TRPAGELNELDVYTDRDGKITLNYVAGTDDLAVVTFSGTDVAPKVDGQINEATLTAAVLSVLPDDFNVDEWERSYDGSDYGSMLTYVKKIGEYQTIERVEAIFDFEGYVMEIRVYNYGQMAEVADKDVDMSALEAAVSGQIQKYYRKAAENPITSIKLISAVMGKDVDGEVYYSVSADITYTNTTSAPASLQVIYFPDRV
ncbi:MAG: hypothetical protein IKT43_05095, partial [Clostridia bacterium]|nr:hypothetical protein [Clostridia bacterium]